MLYQALETEMGGVKVYETALQCAINKDLKQEWSDYLEQTRQHVRALLDMCEKLGLDSDAESPGRRVVRYVDESLVSAMTMRCRAVHAKLRRSLRPSVLSTRRPRITSTGG